MKKYLAVAWIIGMAFVVAFFHGAVGEATGDTEWSCPAGTEHTYKLDNLSGDTFIVPTAPQGWEVIGVSIKAGPDHYDYPNARSGDVINVKQDTGHATSHAHICKKRKTWESTTTSTTSSTTSTTTTSTTQPPTTSTTTTSTTDPTTTTAPPASSTTVAATVPPTTIPDSSVAPTTTGTPTTLPVSVSVPDTSTSTTDSPPTPATRITTIAPEPIKELPVTGSSSKLLAIGFLLLIVGSGLCLFVVRQPR